MKRILSVMLGIMVLLVLSYKPGAASSEAGEGKLHLPDLEAVNINVHPPAPNPESVISLHAFVWNNSDVIIEGPIVVNIGIEGIDVVERIIPMLHPWEAIPLEAGFEPLELGEYIAFVEVDPEDIIPERFERNNGALVPFRVGPPFLLPDLAIIDMKVFPREISVEDDVLIEGMVWNNSAIAIWEPVVIQMGIDDLPAGEPIVLPGLFPREARRVAVTVRAPEVGEHVALMFVDPENVIWEKHEENNHRFVPFEVFPPPGEIMMR